MNKKRRTLLNAVLDGLERLRDPIDKQEAIDILQESKDQTEECMDEEQDSLDAMPESLQWSTANDRMTDNVSDLSGAVDKMEILVEQCENMKVYSYNRIKDGVIKAVNLIKQAIHR